MFKTRIAVHYPNGGNQCTDQPRWIPTGEITKWAPRVITGRIG
ncbi:MAG: hypothetical protein ACFFD4_36470 [Candidatus Odinarchaeota archaeon]